VTFDLSRRSFFGWFGFSGCYSASRRQSTSQFALRLSSPGSVDLNSTAEQPIDIAHSTGAKSAFARVIIVDVIQDDPTIDTSAVLWAAGYPVYDAAASTDKNVRVLVKFAAPAGVPAAGRARILFET
jgi:hypothetical protein